MSDVDDPSSSIKKYSFSLTFDYCAQNRYYYYFKSQDQLIYSSIILALKCKTKKNNFYKTILKTKNKINRNLNIQLYNKIHLLELSQNIAKTKIKL